MSEHEAIVESAEDGEAKRGLLEILRAQPLSDESKAQIFVDPGTGSAIIIDEKGNVKRA